jgi:oligoendopeptidase F
MQSPDRNLRKSAFDSLYSTYGNFKNTTASILSSQVEQLTFHARVRNYNSNLEASLMGNHVPVEVYHNLIKSVHENMHYMYKYAKLRKKILGVDELHMYDMYVPLVKDYDVNIPFEQARLEVEESLKVMGEEYVNIYRSAFTEKWIDIYENVGKCSGAYSAGARVHPYVLLNYNDTLDSEFTLAHEMGHAIHSYYSNKYQPYIYSNYVIFVAEVASTCNESLLMQHLLKNTQDKKARAYLINYFLEQFRTTLYRQTMFAEFELKINELVQSGQSLTADMLCEIYGELNKLYFGEDVVIDENIKLEWSRIPHFYYDFYVYQYATGFSCAIALSMKILNEGESAVKDYIDFLKGGCSKNPVDLLKGAGVDVMSGDVVSQALELFGKLIDELDELVD